MIKMARVGLIVDLNNACTSLFLVLDLNLLMLRVCTFSGN